FFESERGAELVSTRALFDREVKCARLVPSERVSLKDVADESFVWTGEDPGSHLELCRKRLVAHCRSSCENPAAYPFRIIASRPLPEGTSLRYVIRACLRAITRHRERISTLDFYPYLTPARRILRDAIRSIAIAC